MIHMQEINLEEVEILEAYTFNVRHKDPGWYAKLILWWCYRGTNIPKEERVDHSASGFKFKYLGNIYFKIFEAASKYQCLDFNTWRVDYHIVKYCDDIKAFNLNQDKIKGVFATAISHLGTPYGKSSILGLVINDLTRLVTVGVNGVKKLICSEDAIRLYEQFIRLIHNIVGPIDYYDPYELEQLFPMIKYNGELD